MYDGINARISIFDKVIKAAICFPNANSIAFTNSMANDFKYTLKLKSKGEITDLKIIDDSNGLIVYFTLSFINNSDDINNMNNFINVLNSPFFIQLMFNDSNL